MRRQLPAVLALLALCLLPVAAHAHGVLRRSEPAAGARLTEVPRRIRLTFNEAPAPAFTRLALRSAAGTGVTLGPVRIESDTVVLAEIAGALIPGDYVIAWQVAGADAHPVRGEIRFTIAPGAAGLTGTAAAVGGEAGAVVPAPAGSGPPAEHHPSPAAGATTFDAESPAFVAVRSLLYFAILGVIGAVAFRGFVLRRGVTGASYQALRLAAERRAASIGMWAARATIVAALLRLLAQSYAMHGAEALAPSLVATMVMQTLWGWGWIAQLAAAVVAERAFHGAHDRALHGDGESPGSAWSLATGAAVVLAATPALASHAAAAQRLVPVAIAADALHVLAAGAWIGGLALLLAAGVPAALSAERQHLTGVAGLVRAFSPVALTSAALLAITGTFAAWLHVGSIQGLWSTTYGRVLLIKLGILGAVAALGFVNWRFVLPVLESETGARRFTRSGALELGFGAIVIIVTAVLVALPTS